jgi:hypothetical protein
MVNVAPVRWMIFRVTPASLRGPVDWLEELEDCVTTARNCRWDGRGPESLNINVKFDLLEREIISFL